MQQEPLKPFEDQTLKAALRRVLPIDEKAPQSLRDRILALSNQASDNDTPTGIAGRIDPTAAPATVSPFRRSPLFRFAVAAVLVLGFGSLGYQLWEMNRKPVYDPGDAISIALFEQMVKTHESRAAGTGGADAIPATAFAGAGAELSKKIGRAVWVPDLSKAGYSFAGASVRKISEIDSAQLFYTKGAQTLSVLSMPSSLTYAKEGFVYDKNFNNSPIAGFIKGDGLFCIIGGAGLPLAEVKALLAAHQAELVKS